MKPGSMFSLTGLVRVFGNAKFIRRLHDFLLHGGRVSRAETLAHTAKVVLELEQADSQRIQNTKALAQLMRDAGFTEEQVHAKLADRHAVDRVQAALDSLSRYVEEESVSVRVVSPPKLVAYRSAPSDFAPSISYPTVTVTVLPSKVITTPLPTQRPTLTDERTRKRRSTKESPPSDPGPTDA